MMLQGVHHIALWVSDLSRAKEFYGARLGFTVIRETPRAERGDVILDMRMGDIALELFCGGAHPPRASYPEALGLRHLAFRVDDMDAAVKALREAGIEPEPIRADAYTGKRMTFFFDPDGQPLELQEA